MSSAKYNSNLNLIYSVLHSAAKPDGEKQTEKRQSEEKGRPAVAAA